MKYEKRTGTMLRRFKSIRSAIFAAVSLLVLCAVLIVTFVSLRFTRSSIYDNAVVYTQTIIRQMNQSIDSYITYMDNIATMISGSEDAQSYLYQEDGDARDEMGHKKRLIEQFATILKSRDDIKNIGIIRNDGKGLFNSGLQYVNPYLNVAEQNWYEEAVNSSKSVLTSSHVQHAIKGERPWVITLFLST